MIPGTRAAALSRHSTAAGAALAVLPQTGKENAAATAAMPTKTVLQPSGSATTARSQPPHLKPHQQSAPLQPRRVLGNITNNGRARQLQHPPVASKQTSAAAATASTASHGSGNGSGVVFPREVETMHTCDYVAPPRAAATFGGLDLRLLASCLVFAPPSLPSSSAAASHRLCDPVHVEPEPVPALPMRPPLPPLDDDPVTPLASHATTTTATATAAGDSDDGMSVVRVL